MDLSTQRATETLLDADAPQGYSQFLLRRTIAAGVVIVALAVVAGVVLWGRIEQSERDEDLAFTAALALAIPSSVGELAVASGREALVWRPGEQLEVFQSATPANPRFDRWRVSTRDQALASAEGRFLRLDTESGRVETTSTAGPADGRWRLRVLDGNVPLGFDGLDGALVELANSKSGRYLNATDNGRVVQSLSAAEGDTWRFERIGTGVFQVRHLDTGELLDADGAADRYRVDLASASGRDTEWELTLGSDGSYQLMNASRSTIEDRQFESRDPSGELWWHTTMGTIDGATLVTSRRVGSAMALAEFIARAIAVAAGFSVLAVVWLWWTMHKRVAQPLQNLVTAGDDLRVRGELRPWIRQAVLDVDDRPAEFRELGRILGGIETDTQRGLLQSSSLLAAASALGGSLEPSTVLASTLDHLERLLQVDRSAIVSYDPRIEMCEVIASRGHSAEYLNELVAEAPDPTLPSRRAARERVPVQVPDTQSELVSPGMRARSHRHGYLSILAVPLTADLEHPTVLTLHARESRTFSFDEIELSKSFASIAGAAIRNAELFARTDDDLRRQTSQLDAIVESVDQAILVESAEGELLYSNARMHALAGSIDPQAGSRAVDLLDAVASRTADRGRTLEQLQSLEARADTWVDIEIQPGPTAHRSTTEFHRASAFDVVDSRGHQIGRGYVWANITGDRELDVMKRGLLATVSHEFRTPLALIKGYATTLLADDVQWNPQEQSEFLTMVSVEADRLSNLVQRLLDMRRIDAGMVTLQKISTEAAVIVASTLDGMLHQRDRIVVSEVPSLSISVDATRIITTLRNLVENACTYSPDGSMVELSVAEAEHEVVFTVRDYGPGVVPHLRERIFDTFVRGDSALDAEFSGVGLGLAIARGFVEAHDGRIWVSDPESGSGAVFGFSIPYSHASDASRTPMTSST